MSNRWYSTLSSSFDSKFEKKNLLYEYCNYMECEHLLEYLKSEVDWLKFAIQM